MVKNLNIKFIILLGTIFVLLSIFSYLIRGKLIERHEQQQIENLKTILHTSLALKAKQIQDFTTELVEHLTEFGNSSTTTDEIISSVTNLDKKNRILLKFQTICKTFNFLSARLVNLQGNLIYSYPENAPVPGKFVKLNLQKIAQTKTITLSDIHQYQDTGIIHLDLYIPILNRGEVSYAVIFEVTPEDKLYPYIEQNYTPFSTYRTYLLRRDPDGITFLNNCHTDEKLAFKLKIPYNDTEYVAVKAATAPGKLISGLDHRKLPVYAISDSVPSMNWILISEIEQSEFLETNKSFTIIANLLILTLIFLSAVTLTLIWRHTRVKFYKTLYNLELEKQVLEQHFNEVFENAHDAIILCDEYGKITNANKQALTLYQYNAEQIKGLTVNDLQQEGYRGILQPSLIDTLKQGRTIESVHIKSDGSTFPVEISEKYIYVDNHRFLQLIIRDITERRNLEEKLKKQLYLFSVLSQMNQLIVRERDFEQLISQVPSILSSSGNFQASAIITYSENGILQNIYFKSESASVFSQDITKPLCEKLLALCVKNHDVLIINDTLSHPALSEFASFLTAHKLFSLICTPIIYKQYINAFLTVFGRKKDYFSEDDKYLFQEIASDLSYAKEAMDKENMLKESELRFRTIFDNANDAIMLLHNYKFIDFNNKTLELFAAQRDDIIGKFPYELSPEFQPDGRPSKDAAFELINAALQGNRQIFDWTHKKLNGELFICEISLTKISLGGEDYIIAILRDVTEFMEYKNKLEQLNLRFNLALVSGEIGTFDYDIKKGVLFLDEFSHKMLGLEPGTFSGKFEDFLSFVHPEDLNKFTTVIKDLFDSSSNYFEYEVRLITVQGEIKHKLLRATILRDKTNVPLRATGISLDITKRKLQELELLEAKTRAEAANRVKSNILSSLSHEIRTPLTGILGFAELLKDTLHSEEEREMAELILTSGQRLLNTLTSILNLSRIEADRIEVNKSITDLSECVRQAGSLFISMAETKNLKIKFDLEPAVCANIDSNLLHQVLNNLIHNAIAYTNAGHITLRTFKEYKNNTPLAVIEVEDTGIGIPEDKLDIIFEPFRQVSEGVNRKFEGVGLGLTLAKGIVEKMNGSITASSKLGHGSIFRVTFEAIDSHIEKSPYVDSLTPPVKVTKKLPAILHIDDDPLTILTVKHFLKNFAIIDSASTGPDGIKLAKSKNYNCILLDIGLAGLSGLDTLKEIKSIPYYNNIPIIAVTAYAVSGDKEYFLSKGCTHYLSKPFTKKELIDFLKEIDIIQ